MDPNNPTQQGGDQPVQPGEPQQPPVGQPTEPSQPRAEEKCLACGNAASAGNCVPCGQGVVNCTCPPAAPSGEGGGTGGPAMGGTEPQGVPPAV